MSLILWWAAVQALESPPDTWVKRSPLPGGPVSPRLGYEGDCTWIPTHRVLLRYGGHNQGGGGEQHAEVWLYDPPTARWTLREPNTSPPGVCCEQQNLFDPIGGRYVRFPSFSGSHGWQWFREIYLNDSSVWTYDVEENRWRDRRPIPAPSLAPLRCASWDDEFGVMVVFGGEGSREGTLVYDPGDNTWTRMRPAFEPAGRSGGNMAYDAPRRRHILFGAQFDDDPHTWAYDLRRNVWTDLKPATQPPTAQNDAVLAYDPFSRAILAIVKITEGAEENARHRLETWIYDGERNAWTKANPEREPDASGNRARNLRFAPELGVAILENHPQAVREQQIWTYRRGDARPLRPVKFNVVANELSWEGVEGPVDLYGGAGPNAWSVAFEKIGTARSSPWRDEAPSRGPGWFYRLGPEGPIARAQPRLVEDVVVSVLDPRRVKLSWKPPRGPDPAGYVVERARVEVYAEDQLRRLKSKTPPLDPPSAGAIRRIGEFERLTPAPVRGPAWTDEAVDLARPRSIEGRPLWTRELHEEHVDAAGTPYRFAVFAYRVRAVDARGAEGGPSPAVFTLPSSPEDLFSKEDGTTCRLKWRPNPEEGIVGYRVYRMDGRWDKDPLTRLTLEPLRACAFADAEAGRHARRYYVVAVDAIGQEGRPSAPVWFEREWKSFYAPFTGEWHQ
jgi:hypothetical protein